MQDPQLMKEKAAQCRRLVRHATIGRFAIKGSNYLLELAERYEREAARIAASRRPANSNIQAA